MEYIIYRVQSLQMSSGSKLYIILLFFFLLSWVPNCWLFFMSSQFEQQANEVVAAVPWVKTVNVTMSAQPAKPVFAGQLPVGLQTISNIVAVSSCKVKNSEQLLLVSVFLSIKFMLSGLSCLILGPPRYCELGALIPNRVHSLPKTPTLASAYFGLHRLRKRQAFLTFYLYQYT